MYRLLVVDDEEIIVNGLYDIFRGLQELDLDVYKAYSGEEAIEWLNRTRIDVVLTDINMPEIDGLRLFEEIRKSWPQCRVIFLTGHSEFEYVYKAIQHPGVSYILKTEAIEKVIHAVESAIKEIRKEIKTEDLIHQAKEQMNMARELFQKDYFIHLLNGDTSLSIDNDQFKQLASTLQADWPVLLVLGHMDSLPLKQNYWEQIQHLYSVRQIIGRYLATYANSMIVLDESYHFVIFVQPKESVLANAAYSDEQAVHYNKTVSFLRGTLESIQNACREALGTTISFAVSGSPCAWNAVSSKYFALNQLVNYRIGSGVESLLFDDELQNSIRNSESVMESVETGTGADELETLLRQKNYQVLVHYLESDQQDKFDEIVQELLVPLRAIPSKSSRVATEAYYTVSLALLSHINRWKLTEKVAFLIGQNQLMRTDLFDTWEDAAAYLWELSRILFKIQTDEQRKRADNTVDYLRHFIQKHLDEDLSLVRLAEQVYLNPSYLSRLYKQVAGEKLSEFIDGVRLKTAKELLENNRLKINEVARQVGYETAASFTRFFKKAYGTSPQEYRDSLLHGKQLTEK